MLKKTIDVFREALRGRRHVAQRLNVLAHGLLPRKDTVAFHPKTISIIATGRCNLSCEMCPTHSRAVPPEYAHLQEPTSDMTIEVFREVVARFRHATTVNFIGAGEPLMIPDFYRIVEHAAKWRMTIKSFTNGILLNDHASRLASSSLEGMSVSLNSDDPDDFARITKMPARVHEKIVNNTRQFRDVVDNSGSRVKVKASFIVDQDNYRRIPQMLDLAAELNLDRVFFGNYLGNPYAGMSAETRSLWDDSEVIEFLQSVQVPQSLEHKVYLPDLLQRKPPSARACTCHWDQVRVNGDGKVGCCSVMLLDSYVGDDFRAPGLFNGAVFQDRRRRFLSEDAELEDPCYSCPENIGLGAEHYLSRMSARAQSSASTAPPVVRSRPLGKSAKSS